MSDVSRETSQLIQHYADFPDLLRYADLLGSVGVQRGLIGPREVPRLWPRHLANCAVVAQEGSLVPTRADVADVGSGAGLPGIVWAIVRPDLTVTLIEPLLRRSDFLREAVDDLGLSNRVEVIRSRAEDLHGRTFDVVTARAVAGLPQLLAWTLPLVGKDGSVIALKGAGVVEELPASADVLHRFGCAPPDVLQVGTMLLDPPTTIVHVRR